MKRKASRIFLIGAVIAAGSMVGTSGQAVGVDDGGPGQVELDSPSSSITSK